MRDDASALTPTERGVKSWQEIHPARAAVARAELREALIDLCAQLFETELRADLEEASRRRDTAKDAAADSTPDRITVRLVQLAGDDEAAKCRDRPIERSERAVGLRLAEAVLAGARLSPKAVPSSVGSPAA